MIPLHKKIETQSFKKIFIARLIIALCFVINPFCFQLLHAQETQKPAITKSVLLSDQEWKSIEGIYQNPGNKDMYVQFTAGENILIAKLLWNNNELHLQPETNLAFTSKEGGDEGPIHITFMKDSSGKVNQVNVANNGVWNRAKDYKPVVKKEMDHTPEQLKKFEGWYQLQNDQTRYIQLFVSENKLFLKQPAAGGDEPLAFVPENEMDFFSKESPLFSLSFVKDKDGNITQAVAFKRDNWNKVKKVSPTTAELKILEGKYQFKDDPDNYMQVTAKANHLIIKQLWDNKEIIVEPIGENYFYNTDQSYPFLIIKDKEGVVKQALVLGNDLFNKVGN